MNADTDIMRNLQILMRSDSLKEEEVDSLLPYLEEISYEGKNYIVFSPKITEDNKYLGINVKVIPKGAKEVLENLREIKSDLKKASGLQKNKLIDQFHEALKEFYSYFLKGSIPWKKIRL